MRVTIQLDNFNAGDEMSRSYRKPYQTFCCAGAKEKRRWKRESWAQFREHLKHTDEPFFVSYYRKFINAWDRPGEFKYLTQNPKLARK